ncbi:MAG: hypothetical protein U1F25_16555 [Rubrivivax sp.]
MAATAAGRASALAALVTLVAGCVVVPVTRDVYDPDCRLHRREVQLEAAVLGQFHSCAGQECSALLVTLGVVSAATLVVSGSLAVVGNVVYWMEHEVNCRRQRSNVPPAAGPTGTAPPGSAPGSAPATVPGNPPGAAAPLPS